jgi:ParB-like chromosome segregation protein Spo0J
VKPKLENPKSRRPPAPKWPADKVERWPLAKLVPYARNARTHSEAQIDAIAASIREWGWTMPLLIDTKGELIAGHGRVLAAHKLDLKEAPVMVARGWSRGKIRAYRIADNKLALNSGWDEELLGLEFADLREMGIELTLTGFETADIDALIAGQQPPGEFTPYDETVSVEHECPRCHFKWSGTATARREQAA